MRVLILAAVPGKPPLGGGTTALLNLGKSLRENGHQVDYLLSEDFPWKLGSGRWATLAVPWAALWRLAAGPRYDVVDITSGDGVLFLALRRAGILRKHGAVVMRSHGSEHMYAELLKVASREGLIHLSPAFRARYFGVRLSEVAHSLRWADRIICLTRREADGVSERIRVDRAKFSVVAHGVADEFLSLNGDAGGKRDQVIFVGTWVWSKGTQLLPAMFMRLHGRYPSLRFLLAGVQAPEDAVRQAFPAELQGCIEVVGYVPQRELARRMAESLLMIFPSYYDGFGMVALEAMAAGTPVVMSREVGASDWIDEEGLALLAPLDPEAFAAGCERLLDDPALRGQVAARAKIWARRFTWQRAAEETVAAYTQALAAQGKD